MNYIDRLNISAEKSGNITCMGLDLIHECIPEKSGNFEKDATLFVEKVFSLMKKQGVMPGAFKPNIGYYHAIDAPLKGDFSGSKALANIIHLCKEYFPKIPIIIDSKRGDIARSSLNYAWEGYDNWGGHAITVSPYMGNDSVSPFWDNFTPQSHAPNSAVSATQGANPDSAAGTLKSAPSSDAQCAGRGIYVLNRTSNPGAMSFQSKMVGNKPLYMVVAADIKRWATDNPGVGAVVGATSLEELRQVAAHYTVSTQSHYQGVPLLIPGVGSQGGSATDTIETLKSVEYNLSLARINSSSGITHPWKTKPAPTDWAGTVVRNIEHLAKELAL